MRTAMGATPGQAQAGLAAQVDSLAPAPRPRGGRGFGQPSPAGPPTLDGVSDALRGAAMAMQNADVAPTAAQLAACDRARAQAGEVMARWTRLKAALSRP
jgi:hypothetical protein